MTPADQLNAACAAHQAAREATAKAAETHQRLTAEVERERTAYAKAQAAQDAAIEASLTDASVHVPHVSRDALSLAERKLAAGERALEKAREAETTSKAGLTAAEVAHLTALGIEQGQSLYAEIVKLKPLLTLLALQENDAVRVALHDAGFRVGRSPDTHGLVIHCPGPARVPSASEAAAASISPRSAPAAAKHLRALVEAESAQRDRERDLIFTGVDQNENAALQRLDALHTSAVQNANPVMRAALGARHLMDVQRVKAEYRAQRKRAEQTYGAPTAPDADPEPARARA